MSQDLFQDINDMHKKFGADNSVISTFSKEKLEGFLDFRINFLKEEMTELLEAREVGDAEGVVDAIVDLLVVGIGTLDAMGVDGKKAWDAVHEANMAKEAGSNPTRPNKFGLPDLVKPVGWQAPSHEGNHGLITRVFESQCSL